MTPVSQHVPLVSEKYVCALDVAMDDGLRLLTVKVVQTLHSSKQGTRRHKKTTAIESASGGNQTTAGCVGRVDTATIHNI
jgi:hypothetical protein